MAGINEFEIETSLIPMDDSHTHSLLTLTDVDEVIDSILVDFKAKTISDYSGHLLCEFKV